MKIIFKRLIIGLTSLILFVILGIFVATFLIDPNQYKSSIESTSASAGIELSIEGDLAWQLFPLGISAEDVNFVLSDKSMSGSADQLKLEIELATLFSLVSQRSQLPISNLSIANGRVLYALPNSLPLQFSQINIAVENLNSTGHKFPISMDLLAPYGIRITVQSDVAAKVSKQTVTDFSVTNLQLKINNILFTGYFDTSNNFTKIQGNIKSESFNLIKQLKLAKRFIPDLVVPQFSDSNALTDVTFDSFFDIESMGFSKIQTMMSIDGQILDVDVEIDQQKYRLNTLVSGRVLNLDTYILEPLATTDNSMFFAPLAIPMTLWHGQSHLELNLMAVEFGDTRLSNFYANLFGNQNIFRLTSFNADIFGGQINIIASLNMQEAKPKFFIESSITNIDLTDLSKSFEDINLGGELNLNATISGSGNTSNSIIESLDGVGEAYIENPRFIGVNLEQNICNAAAMFGGNSIPENSWPENTKLSTLEGKFLFKTGSLLVNDYQTRLANIDIYGNANLNLSSKRYSLNTIALATQPKSSPLGCRINPIIVKREIPFKCMGAFGDEFECKPDNNLIQTLLSPKL